MYILIIGIVVFSLLLYLLRQWIKGPRFTEQIDGHGRVAIVTGANSELGKEIVRELMQRNIRVYMLCQSLERGNQAKQALVKNYGCNPRQMLVMQVDLWDFQSIRDFVTDFSQDQSHLDILVNYSWIRKADEDMNPFVAGISFFSGERWEPDWESNFGGHFLLTQLLRPALEASVAGGRVVNVSSLAQVPAHSRPDKKFYERTFTNLAQVLYAIELTKRIRQDNPDSKVTINACHPELQQQRDFHGRRLINFLYRLLFWFVQRTANDEAQTPLFLALSKKIEGVSGKCFSNCVERADRLNAFAPYAQQCEEIFNKWMNDLAD